MKNHLRERVVGVEDVVAADENRATAVGRGIRMRRAFNAKANAFRTNDPHERERVVVTVIRAAEKLGHVRQR
ncbi:hypothetical protein [Methylocaldum sp.]|uniref:hypothetical protein n=1 Tax=Methylocaldum sp. TaxID=1969727 RepID=UPI002D6621BF|nr:hypothetical protein [Methylocaldum sp.]HYE34268.1 hypothetical protein [Methylocaldum sp.]